MHNKHSEGPITRMDNGHALVPKERYTSKEFMQLEWQHVWTRTWLLAARCEDLTNIGDQVMFDIGQESVVIVRSSTAEIQAFYNTCPHRGARLMNCEKTNQEMVRCPYHGWEWHLDGRLKRIHDPTFLQKGKDHPELRLIPVKTQLWGGFVWINFDPNAKPLEEFLGTITQRIEPYLLEKHTLIRDITLEWECNWKVSLDNSNETCHVQAVHPQLLDLLNDEDTKPEIHTDHSCFWVRFGVVSPKRGPLAPNTIPEGLRGIMEKLGLPPSNFRGTISEVREALKQSAKKLFEERQISYPNLSDDELIDNFHGHVFPNLMFNILPPGYWLFRARPHPFDPNRMLMDFQEYERYSPQTKKPRPEHKYYQNANISLDAVLDQDAAILPEVQRGMLSSGFKFLRLGMQEQRLRHMHEVLDRYIYPKNT